MKPALTMEGKPTVDVPCDVPEIRNVRSSRRNVLIIGAVIGVVFFLVVAGVSVGTFYLGMQANQESFKEAWVKFKTADSDTIIKERVIVKENEVDIRRPGVMRMVVDYSNNWLVMQFDKELQGDERVYCYVYEFEPGMFGSRQAAEDTVTSDQDAQVVPSRGKVVYESTGIEVPIEDLSPAARDMCFDATILKVKKSDKYDEVRRKRGCSWTCALTCSWGGCTPSCTIKCN